MKELSIEEKALRYDKAIKEASIAYKDEDKHLKATLERIFPELKESEGERIRKELIDYLKSFIPHHDCDLVSKSKVWIAWLEKQGQTFTKKDIEDAYLKGVCDTKHELEKQGEQKHKFNIGDIISNGQAVYRVDDITKNCIGQDCYFLVHVESEKNGLRYLLSFTDSEGKHSNFGEITLLCEHVDKSFEKQEEQKPADKAERKGMNIVEEDMTPFQKKVFCIIDTAIEEEQGLKQVCDELLRLAHDEIMQNPAWSEDDEKMRLELIQYFVDGNDLKHNLAYIFDWLKSFKDRVQPQNTWKPSDEQMQLLKEACDQHWEPDGLDPLYTLYQDLLKLKG